MSKAEKILEEIKKRYEYWREKESNSHSIESESRMSECNHLLSMIISLSDTEKDFSIKESVIPFGASDSELMEATYFIPQGYHAVIEGNKVIIKKGEEPVSEDLEEAACEYDNNLAFEAGAQWQKEQMIDKACEWLKSYRQDTPDGTGYIPGIINDETIEDFKQSMKE